MLELRNPELLKKDELALLERDEMKELLRALDALLALDGGAEIARELGIVEFEDVALEDVALKDEALETAAVAALACC